MPTERFFRKKRGVVARRRAGWLGAGHEFRQSWSLPEIGPGVAPRRPAH